MVNTTLEFLSYFWIATRFATGSELTESIRVNEAIDIYVTTSLTNSQFTDL